MHRSTKGLLVSAAQGVSLADSPATELRLPWGRECFREYRRSGRSRAYLAWFNNLPLERRLIFLDRLLERRPYRPKRARLRDPQSYEVHPPLDQL